MDRITRFSLKNATVIIVAVLMIAFGGVYSAGQLERETMPDVSIPIVAVVTPYPGAGPADVYEDITKPMERAVAGVVGIESMSGSSNDSVSVVVAEFSYSADMDEAEADIAKAIDDVELPDNALASSIARISFGSQPIMKLAVYGGESAEMLRTDVRDDVVTRLSAVDGVGEVRTSDDGEGAIRIEFKPDALESYGVSAQDVVQQIRATNLSFPVGTITVAGIEEPVRVAGTLATVDDLKAMQIALYPDLGSTFGEALGELGKNLGNVAGGLGKQIGLLAALQDTQAKLLDAKIGLAEANTVLADPAASAEAKAVAQGTAAQLGPTIQALEAAVSGLKSQLAAAGAGASATATATASATSSAAATGAPEPTIELVELGKLADVTFDPGYEAAYSRRDGEPALLIDLVKTQDANAVKVSEDVLDEIESLRKDMPAGVKVAVTYDAAVTINDSIMDMVNEGLLGAFFAFLVILVFLRNWRSTLIAAISIPLSVVTALLFLQWFDVTLNVMTLGGMTVAIGRVVDDSIVVIENIFRHLQIGTKRNVELIRMATHEVSAAITSSTLTTVAVFAPMALVSGIVGKVFTPFALTVALALLASLLVAVTLVPLIAKWGLLWSKVPSWDEDAAKVTGRYARLMKWSLSHRWVVLLVAGALFFGTLGLLPIIGFGFMPHSPENYATIDVRYPAGTPAETVDDALSRVEERLSELDWVDYYQVQVGASSGFDISSGSNQGTVFAKISDDVDLDEAVETLRYTVEPLKDEGAHVAVAQVDVTGAGANSVEIVITGRDFEAVGAAASEIESAVADVEGLENASSNLSEARKQVSVEVDQKKAAAQGLNAALVAQTVRGFVADQEAGTMQVDGRDATLVFSTAADGVASAEDIAAREILTPLGDIVKVGDVARVEETATPVSILTLEEQEFAAVTASVTDRNSSVVIARIEKRIDELELPAGVEVSISGMAEMMDESFRQLGLAMLIAVAAVYLVMVIAFGEATAPLAIMGSLPLATIGGIVALFIVGIPLDMPAMIGALMLIGIVTTNAIVLIDRVQQRLADGLSRREALIDAGSTRIRPILMTALTTIMALLPLASGVAGGTLTSQSLAIVVVGGLTTSTGLTLVVVPVVYDLLESIKERVMAMGARRHAEFAEDAESVVAEV